MEFVHTVVDKACVHGVSVAVEEPEQSARLAVLIDAVEVETRHPGGRHVMHLQGAFDHIANFNLRRVGVEVDGESRGVARKVPHRAAHISERPVGKTVVGISDFRSPALVLDNREAGFHRVELFPPVGMGCGGACECGRDKKCAQGLCHCHVILNGSDKVSQCGGIIVYGGVYYFWTVLLKLLP